MQTENMQALFWRVRSNKVFEICVISIIMLSALLIGAKTYNIPPQVDLVIRILDYAITAFFITEITIRFMAEKNKSRFLLNGWNLFDTLIVIASIMPVQDSDLAVVGRLIRIFRVLRMVSIIPELRVLLNSLIKALPQLGYVVALMFIIFYIYAAIGTTFFEKINPTLWGDISISMLTLFRVMTFEDWTDVMYETMAVHPLSWVFYITFIFLTAFAFLNMVIGIVVSVLEKENARIAAENAEAEPSPNELLNEIKELKSMVARLQQDRV